ncbi:sugar ABC transporter substrate-binding protein [Caproiciproducens sp. CPB-2]|uniref:sugar ABC transporter substrate-binding protein n=1 Tax=Caproiciproducens sp. CPB-2 TaxID=3030017 RepID=UPI0023DA6D90|nr:substrate-binding domain-containing protein [Caproiciproducens sp. CPB-2]MDF1494953.1 substrate-binding domain-containing protein [Caproiciproducens sp. CPB-2]
MSIKKILAALLVGVMAIGLTACGPSSTMQASASPSGEETSEAPSSPNKQIKIAYIVKAKTDAFWTDMEKGSDDYAKEKGIEVDFQAPAKETDVEQQVNMVSNAVVKGYNAIILSAADSKALIPAIVQANKANIPVILVNDTIDNDALEQAGGKVETYVGIDQSEAASLAGKYAAEHIKDGKIAYLEGISGVAAHADRLNGFKGQCSAFQVIASQTAKCDRNEAFNVMQNILSAHPDVNVVWAINAEMGQGALQAIEQGGFKGKVSVFDFDASPDDVAAIEAGTLTGTVAQYPNLQAKGAIQACLDVLDGKKLESHTKTPAALVTKDNVADFKAGKDIT